MQYIQISSDFSTKGFYLLIRQGAKEGNVEVLPNHVYVVNESQIQILKKEGIPFNIVTKEQLSVQTS